VVLALSDTATTPFIPPLEDGAPSVDQVMNMLSSGITYFSAFKKQCETTDTYYNGENIIPKVEGFDVERPATAKAIIDTAADHIDVGHAAIDVIPSSPRARARAERLRKFYIGTWANIKSPVKRDVVKMAFAYGISFFKVSFVPDQWPDAPVEDDFGDEQAFKEALSNWMDRRNLAFPIQVSAIDPKNLIWDDSRTGIHWAIEHYQRDIKSIKYRYPTWSSPNGETTDWIEYWDEEWCGYIANREWVWGPYRHNYGFLPFIPVVAGDGLTTATGPLHRRYRGMLTPVTNLLDAEARLATQYEAIIRQFAWQSLDFTGPTGSADATRETYEFMGKNLIPSGVTVSASPRTSPPPEILQQLNIIQTLIEEATFPNVVRGVRPRGVSSGFGISVLAGMGRLKFQGVADGVARAIEQVNSGFARLIENKIRGRITVHARSEVHNFDQTIGPDDIRGFVENLVALKAEAPEERERESFLALRLWNNGQGIISTQEAMKRSGVANPLEMMNEIGAERILRDPIFLQAQTQGAAGRFGLLTQLAQMADQPPGQGGLGNEFLPGLGAGQGNRVNEAGIQAQRMVTRQNNEATPSVFPQGMGGVGLLGGLLGAQPGGAQGVPSGQTVR
jgi:hypothetical protein